MDSTLLRQIIPPITYLIIHVIILTVTGCFVTIRVATEYLQNRKLFLDDYLSVIALIFLTSLTASSSMTISLLDRNTEVAPLFKASLILCILVTLSMFFAKTPILALYIRLFGIKRWVRITCCVTLVTTLLQYLAIAALVGASCIPAGTSEVNLDDKVTICLSRMFAVGLWNGIISILTDLIALCIPIPVIVHLQIPFCQKIGIGAVFVTGLLAIAASSISFHYKRMSSMGTSGDWSIAMMCTSIECSIAIIVSCAPAVHVFWFRYIVKLSDYLKIPAVFNASTDTQHELRPLQAGFQTPQSQIELPPRIHSLQQSYIELYPLNFTKSA